MQSLEMRRRQRVSVSVGGNPKALEMAFPFGKIDHRLRS
ncbi:hypothetical protein GGQ75_004040 [Aureimonas phyllosphaerae]|nr:hypothetical protein [Aureimonas phyllosphaerae]